MSKATDKNIIAPRWIGDGARIARSNHMDFFKSFSAPAGEDVLTGVAVWKDFRTGIVYTGLPTTPAEGEIVLIQGIAITEPVDNKNVTYQQGDLVAVLTDGIAGIDVPYLSVSDQAVLWVHEDTGVFSGIDGEGFHKVGNVKLLPSLCRSDFLVVTITPNLRKDFL